MEYITLINGVKMPIIGYGVYQISKSDCKDCVLKALQIGYRHIDTAQAYHNEEEVGQAIKESGINRQDIFITTKVSNDHFGYDACIKSVKESLRKLQTDYIDLVLLHQPFGDTYGAWRALETLYEQGLIKAIGVSNFYPDRVVDMALFNKIPPMVNQIEIHPLYQQDEALKWNSKYQIKVEAWAPFGEGKANMFQNETLQKIAQKHHKTVAQVILRWLVQRKIVALPKTVHEDRMKENISIFDFTLDDKDLELISYLDTKTSLFFSHQDPKMVEWFGKNV